MIFEIEPSPGSARVASKFPWNPFEWLAASKKVRGRLKNQRAAEVHIENSDEIKRAKEIFKQGGDEEIPSTGESTLPKDKNVKKQSRQSNDPVVIKTRRS